MKILHFDCFSGISGDMILGAFIDLGVDSEVLFSLPKKLKLDQVKIKINKIYKNGIAASRVDIIYPHEHVHRHLSYIEEIIDNGNLQQEVKLLSKKIFSNLAEAESKVHGPTPSKLHFHVVGALDTIFDIVGAASCFVALGIKAAFTGTISVGGGMVKMDHGLYPVPTPATLHLLNGFSIAQGPIEKEIITPTGAAILSTFIDEPQKRPTFTLIKSSFGAGNMTHKNVPNVLRLSLGELNLDIPPNDMIMIETNIDDMNPQFYPILINQLLKTGANDAYLTPILMKKGRPAHTLSVLCNRIKESALLNIIYQETTTIGVRTYKVHKNHLKYKLIKMETTFGEIQVKEITLPDSSIKRIPEFEGCLIIANDMKVAVKYIYDKIFTEINYNLT